MPSLPKPEVRAVSRRNLLLAAISALPVSRAAFAGQSNAAQAPSAPTFSSDVKVVNVFATVRDKQGQIVKNLTKGDFELEEDGRPQTIRYFSQQSELPLVLGLLVDTSGSERRMLGTETDATRSFLEQVLRPDRDKAFLIHFDREVELLQDLTSSRERLEKALDLINRPEWGNGGNSGGNQGGSGGGQGGGRGGGWPGSGGGGAGRRQGQGRGGGGTALYDAIYLASDDLMKNQTGRKALILLTDGEDNGSKESIGEAISVTQRADTLAYSVRIADEESGFTRGFGNGGGMGPGMGRHGGMGGGWPGGGGGRGGQAGSRPDGKKILKQISSETGGAYFEVSKKNTVDTIFKEIEETLRNQYSIGYTSDNTDAQSGYRKIALTVKQKGLAVQARPGYYPKAMGS